MPGWARLRPFDDPKKRIIVTKDDTEVTRYYIVALGSTRVPTAAGWVDVPLEPGQCVHMLPGVPVVKFTGIRDILVRVHDICAWESDTPALDA